MPHPWAACQAEDGAHEPGLITAGDRAAPAGAEVRRGPWVRGAGLRVAVAGGPRVLLRTLLVATGQGRHWLLEGERWQRAVPVSADGLSGRVATLLRLPADG